MSYVGIAEHIMADVCKQEFSGFYFLCMHMAAIVADI